MYRYPYYSMYDYYANFADAEEAVAEAAKAGFLQDLIEKLKYRAGRFDAGAQNLGLSVYDLFGDFSKAAPWLNNPWAKRIGGYGALGLGGLGALGLGTGAYRLGKRLLFGPEE